MFLCRALVLGIYLVLALLCSAAAGDGGAPECRYISFTGNKRRADFSIKLLNSSDVDDTSSADDEGWRIRVQSGVCHYLCTAIHANNHDSFLVAPDTNLTLVGDISNDGWLCDYECKTLWTESHYQFATEFYVDAYMSYIRRDCGWEQYRVSIYKPFDFTCGRVHHYSYIGCDVLIRQEADRSKAQCQNDHIIMEDHCNQYHESFLLGDGPFTFADVISMRVGTTSDGMPRASGNHGHYFVALVLVALTNTLFLTC